MTPPEMALALLIPVLLLIGLWLLPSTPPAVPVAETERAWRPPRAFDRAEALELIGWRGKVHPVDVAAFLHADMEQAQHYAERNAKEFGHPTVLFLMPGGEALAVLDLRPALAELGTEPTRP